MAIPERVGLKYSKTLNREVGGIQYYHHRVTGGTLGDLAERLGWAHGDELEAEVKNGALVVRRKK